MAETTDHVRGLQKNVSAMQDGERHVAPMKLININDLVAGDGRVTIERCINQVFRPKKQSYTPPGKGYCPTCEYDPENNKQCTGYQGVPVTYTIKEEETQ